MSENQEIAVVSRHNPSTRLSMPPRAKMWAVVLIIPWKMTPNMVINWACFVDGMFIGHEVLLQTYWTTKSPPGYDIVIYLIFIS
jgi:hypothetical protein